MTKEEKFNRCKKIIKVLDNLIDHKDSNPEILIEIAPMSVHTDRLETRAYFDGSDAALYNDLREVFMKHAAQCKK